jgi:hypothetical protein
MQSSKWDIDTTLHDDESHVPRADSQDDFTNQMGIRIALVAFCIASFIAAAWFLSGPSFEKCSAVASATERNACYDELRNDLMKPPAKGADIPKS